MLRDSSNATRTPHALSLACALLAATMACGSAAAETPVKFSLDFKIEGTSAPFLLALDKGYYKAEGLNVAIQPSTGSDEAISRVATGGYDMGFADINTMIRYRDANPDAPVIAVFILYNRPPYAVIGRKSRGINTPKDIEGKRLGAPADDSTFAQWPIFVKANGIDASKVTTENVSFPVREPMLAAGQIDAVTGRSFATYIELKDKGVPVNDITVLLMSDYGVELYGSAIIANSKFATANPEVVKGFLRAFLKGLKETVKSPAAAIETVLKRDDTARKELELERLKMAIAQNIVTPEVKADGYGGIASARFERALGQLALTYKFKTAKPKAGDYFDASFLPPPAERKIN